MLCIPQDVHGLVCRNLHTHVPEPGSGTGFQPVVHGQDGRATDYTFWVSGDDETQLYLSTDEDPGSKQMIASVPGWTNSREWTKYPEQKSKPQSLAKGKIYYIEALMKEGTGGDNVAAS
jgi:hypothetical protein